MPTRFFASQAPGQAVRSQVMTEPLGPLVAGSLLVGFAILALPVGATLWSYRWPAAALLLLGAGALGLAWHLATRSSYPLLLTLSPDALRLTPLGRSGALGVVADTIPLASVVAYKHWLSRGRVFARYYLRLELAGGRVLRLADPPGMLPNDPMGAVPLSELVGQLARWVEPGTVVRPLFSQTLAARALLPASGMVGLAALALLWGGHLAAGGLLLTAAGVYVLSYYRARRRAGGSSSGKS